MTDPLGFLNSILGKNEMQLERFMALAEDVSDKIETLITKRNRLVVLAIALAIFFSLIISIFVYGNQAELIKNNKVLLSLSSITILFILFNIIKLLNDAKKIKQDIKHEAYMLGDLLNITNSYKEMLIDQNDALKKQYFDMRMRRINFSHAKFEEQVQHTLPVQQKIAQNQPAKSPISTPT